MWAATAPLPRDGEEMDVPAPWDLWAGCDDVSTRPNIFRILWRAGMVNSAATSIAHREKTDLLLQPPLAQVDMLNWQPSTGPSRWATSTPCGDLRSCRATPPCGSTPSGRAG